MVSAPAKSLSQIQKGEEAALKITITLTTAVSSGGVKKYADVNFLDESLSPLLLLFRVLLPPGSMHPVRAVSREL